MRQADGRLWSWEGCGDSWGCCHGSCTHVWNYAQAVPHLFPSLERTLRETEFRVSQDDRGHQTFRAALPIRPPAHDFHAAADGQLGGIMKVYREWRICGDTRVAAQPVAERQDEPRLLHRHLGPAPHRDARGAAPQHLRHRVLGPRRHVHELLPRRARGRRCRWATALGDPVSGLRGAPREGPPPHGDGALERRVLRPEGAVEGPARRETPRTRRAWSASTRRRRALSSTKEGPKYQYGEGLPLRRRPRRVDGGRVRGRRGPRSRRRPRATSARSTATTSSRTSRPTRTRSGRPSPAATRAACSCAPGRGAAPSPCPSSTRTRCGPGSSTRWPRTSCSWGWSRRGSRSSGPAATATTAASATPSTSTSAATGTPGPCPPTASSRP